MMSSRVIGPSTAASSLIGPTPARATLSAYCRPRVRGATPITMYEIATSTTVVTRASSQGRSGSSATAYWPTSTMAKVEHSICSSSDTFT